VRTVACTSRHLAGFFQTFPRLLLSLTLSLSLALERHHACGHETLAHPRQTVDRTTIA
jgi:hypothetical protein